MFEVAALLQVGVVDVPEGHEGAQELGEGPGHGDVVGGRAGGDAGDLRVHGRVGEHQAPSAEKDLLVGLVEGHLACQHADVFDRVVRGAAAGAQGVRGLGELQLQDQVELGRQELPGLKHADERGCHQHVLEALRGHGRGHEPGELPEAGDALVFVPLRGFQQRVEEAAAPIFGDVIAALPVGEELHPLDKTGRLLGAGVQVQRGVVVAHTEGDFDTFGVDEIHAAGERDSGHSGGGGREGAERAWVVLDVASGLNVVDVRAPELVVQRFDELILDRLGHVLHLYYTYAASGSLA